MITALKEVTLLKTGETSYYWIDDKGIQRSLSVEGWMEAVDGFEYTLHITKTNWTMKVDIYQA